MGGYGSGRIKAHHITDECIPIDTTALLKRKLLPSSGGKVSLSYNLAARMFEHEHNTMRCKEVERAYTNSVGIQVSGDVVTLSYRCKIGDQQMSGPQKIDISLVVTHPNYGGSRYWFLSPCCHRRVRVMYLPLFGPRSLIVPLCRVCLGLHYASQQSSYVERHITREKHLLANYGYSWASMEYMSMREHYFQVTPEYAEKRARSELERELVLLRHFLTFERMMFKCYLRGIRSLVSDDDKLLYLHKIAKDRGNSYALDLIKMLGLSIDFERAVRASTDTSVLDTFTRGLDLLTDEGDTSEEPSIIKALKSKEQDIKQELEYLNAKRAA